MVRVRLRARVTGYGLRVRVRVRIRVRVRPWSRSEGYLMKPLRVKGSRVQGSGLRVRG